MPNPINLNLTVLTDGEKLWLMRRRAGATQRAYAAHFRINHSYYGAMELDARPVTPGVHLGRKLTISEALRLARRRAGISLEAIARQVRVSKVTILKWERAAERRLANYWQDRGFRGIGYPHK